MRFVLFQYAHVEKTNLKVYFEGRTCPLPVTFKKTVFVLTRAVAKPDKIQLERNLCGEKTHRHGVVNGWRKIRF